MKKKKEDKIIKNIREFRHNYTLLLDLKSKFVNKEYNSDESLFELAKNYENVYNLTVLSLFELMENDEKATFLRRTIEFYAISKSSLDLDKVNYHLFKLLLLDREIGEKESEKIKNKIKLNGNVNIKESLEANPLYYLCGINVSDLKNNTLIYENCKEIEGLDKVYDLLSVLTHQGINIYSNSTLLKDLSALLYKSGKSKIPYKIPKLLPLESIYSFDEAFLIAGCDLEEAIIQLTFDNSNLNKISFFAYTLKYICNVLLMMASFIKMDLSSASLIIYRSFLEKIAPFFIVFKTSNEISEVDEKISNYVLATKFCTYNILYGEFIMEERIKEIHDKYFKNINYFVFKQRILNNPSFVVYGKTKSYIQSVTEMLKDNPNKNSLLDIYSKAIDLSHTKLLLIKEKETSLKESALLAINNVIETYDSFIKYAEKYCSFFNKLSEYENLVVKYNIYRKSLNSEILKK